MSEDKFHNMSIFGDEKFAKMKQSEAEWKAKHEQMRQEKLSDMAYSGLCVPKDTTRPWLYTGDATLKDIKRFMMRYNLKWITDYNFESYLVPRRTVGDYGLVTWELDILDKDRFLREFDAIEIVARGDKQT